MNNRPLFYVEDDIQMQILTPNTMLHEISIPKLEVSVSNISENDLRKRARYIEKCKTPAWQRWKTEYLRAIFEHENRRSKAKNQEKSTPNRKRGLDSRGSEKSWEMEYRNCQKTE